MEVLESNGKLYNVIRGIKKSSFKSKDDVKFYRDYIKTDHVLQHNGMYIFCRTIDDVEFEEIEE